MAPNQKMRALVGMVSFAVVVLLREIVAERLETYVVHAPASGMPQVYSSSKLWHSQLIESVKEAATTGEPQRVLYFYGTVMEGFAAQLTASEAASLRAQDGVLMTVKDTLLQLHTTRSPSFLGLFDGGPSNPSTGHLGNIWEISRKGQDVIIGVMDTGIWPEHRSFSDDGYSSVLPSRWKGECETSPTFNGSMVCNKKIIGARSFFKGYQTATGGLNVSTDFLSPRDGNGHGTHTASTAAGSSAPNASLFGLAFGTASGTAPAARLAIYKTCWDQGCSGADILAAFEAAILDGVDVISASLGSDGGSESQVDYFEDPIAIGSFAALSRGIITSASAGNSGPALKSVINVAPWVLTVAASTLDRDFPAPVVLGNGSVIAGASLYGGSGFNGRQLPLIYAGDVLRQGVRSFNASFCVGSALLNATAVKGKIILCDRGINGRAAKGFIAKELGAAGMVVGNLDVNGDELLADSHVLPGTLVGFSGSTLIKDYIHHHPAPTATIFFNGTRLHVKPAPVIADFSSRGPNSVTLEILKPDVTAPGVNILAAWTARVGPTGDVHDNRKVEFNIISGTSMSCPHVSGLVALLKAAHPDWSPSAVKSALMTTGVVTDNLGEPLEDTFTRRPSLPIAHGSGHVHPNAALNPGLVYDMSTQDYVDFVCSLNYTSAMVSVFAPSCDSSFGSLVATRGPSQLNYPSISVVYYQYGNASFFSKTFTRTVTNVGSVYSTYSITIKPPSRVNVTVEPATLCFTPEKKAQTFAVTFMAEPVSLPLAFSEGFSYGWLEWSDGYHRVRSPIGFTWIVAP